MLYDRRGHGRSDPPATRYDIDTLADDLAAVINHFGLHEATLAAHSLGSKEAIRYLTRHGDARIARLVFIAPTTPLLRRTADNPDGLDPALIDANRAAIAANVPAWCASFEAAGPYFGTSPGGSPGLIDWTIRMIVDTRPAAARHPVHRAQPAPERRRVRGDLRGHRGGPAPRVRVGGPG